MAHRAVIFDLFGTLADFSFRALDQVVLEMGELMPVERETYALSWAETYPLHERGTFPTTEASIEYACHAAGIQPSLARVVAAAERWRAFQRGMLMPQPDAVSTLSGLRAASCRIGVITNCPPEVPLLWPQIPLAAHVDVPLFSSEVGLVKPDLGIYLMACERLGVTPSECLFVGDGGSGELRGAVQAGMDAAQLRMLDEDPYDVERFGRESWSGVAISCLAEVLTLWAQ